MTLQRKTVMVTGAAGNLGKAVANAFSEQGAQLVPVDRQVELLRATFGRESTDRMFVQADLLQSEQIAAGLASATARFGRVDVLCNLAGGFRMGEMVHETSGKTWDFLFDINVRTLLNVARAIVPEMISHAGGKIVNVGAYSAQRGAALMGAYTASKAGVIRLTEAMAAELREQNINVNCVLPTIIDTRGSGQALAASPLSSKSFSSIFAMPLFTCCGPCAMVLTVKTSGFLMAGSVSSVARPLARAFNASVRMGDCRRCARV